MRGERRRACHARLRVGHLLLALTLLAGPGCVYFNTFYNAKRAFRQAEVARRKQLRDELVLTGGEPLAQPRLTPQVEQLYDKAARKASKVIERYPASDRVVDAKLLIGRALYWQGNYATASQQFAELEAGLPPGPERDRARFWRAQCDEAQGFTDQAAAAYQVLFQDGAGDLAFQAGVRLGELAAERDDHTGAAQAYQAALRAYPRAPGRAQAWLRLGESLETLADSARFQEALAAYAQATGDDASLETEYRARLNSGRVRQAAGDSAGALVAFDNLLRQSRFRVFEGQTRILLGQHYQEARDYQRALAEFDQVRDDFPQTAAAAMALYRTGLLYLQGFGQIDRARDYLQEVGKEKAGSEPARLAQEKLALLTRLDQINQRIAKAVAAADSAARENQVAGDVQESSAAAAPDSAGVGDPTVDTDSLAVPVPAPSDSRAAPLTGDGVAVGDSATGLSAADGTVAPDLGLPQLTEGSRTALDSSRAPLAPQAAGVGRAPSGSAVGQSAPPAAMPGTASGDVPSMATADSVAGVVAAYRPAPADDRERPAVTTPAMARADKFGDVPSEPDSTGPPPRSAPEGVPPTAPGERRPQAARDAARPAGPKTEPGPTRPTSGTAARPGREASPSPANAATASPGGSSRDRVPTLEEDFLEAAELYRDPDRLAVPDSALRYYQEALRRFPTSEQVPRELYNIGWIHRQTRRDPPAAVPWLERLVAEHPATEHARAAREWLGLPPVETAEAAGARAFRDLELRQLTALLPAAEQIAAFDSLAAAFPGTTVAAKAAYAAAVVLEDAVGDTTGANARFDSLARVAPATRHGKLAQDRLQARRDDAVAKLERGLRAVGGALAPGEELWVVAAEPDSTDSVAWARRELGFGVRAHRRGDLNLAREYYERSLEQRAGQAEAQYRLGQVLLEQGFSGDATERFRRAVALSPGTTKAYYQLLAVFVAERRADSASAYLRQIASRDAGNAKVARLVEQHPDLNDAGKNTELDLETLQSLELTPPPDALTVAMIDLIAEPPLVRQAVAPDFPRQAPTDTATVRVDVLLDGQGRIEQAQVFQGPEAFRAAALAAARRYVFYPAVPAASTARAPAPGQGEARARVPRLWVEITVPFARAGAAVSSSTGSPRPAASTDALVPAAPAAPPDTVGAAAVPVLTPAAADSQVLGVAAHSAQPVGTDGPVPAAPAAPPDTAGGTAVPVLTPAAADSQAAGPPARPSQPGSVRPPAASATTDTARAGITPVTPATEPGGRPEGAAPDSSERAHD